MYRIIFIFSFILLVSTPSFSQYPMDWRNSPANPIPVVHTANHVLVFYDVKTVRSVGNNYDITLGFDKEGNIISWRDAFTDDTYLYDGNGFIKGIKSSIGLRNITTNDKGYPVEASYSDGSGNLFTYNAAGLFSSKIDLKTKTVIEEYEYDSQNRISSAAFYDKNTKELLATLFYEYKDIATHNQLTVNTVYPDGGNETSTKYVTKRGENASERYWEDIFKTDRKSNSTYYKNAADGSTIANTFVYFSDK